MIQNYFSFHILYAHLRLGSDRLDGGQVLFNAFDLSHAFNEMIRVLHDIERQLEIHDLEELFKILTPLCELHEIDWSSKLLHLLHKDRMLATLSYLCAILFVKVL